MMRAFFWHNICHVRCSLLRLSTSTIEQFSPFCRHLGETGEPLQTANANSANLEISCFSHHAGTDPLTWVSQDVATSRFAFGLKVKLVTPSSGGCCT
jgi:hypothetical protein